VRRQVAEDSGLARAEPTRSSSTHGSSESGRTRRVLRSPRSSAHRAEDFGGDPGLGMLTEELSFRGDSGALHVAANTLRRGPRGLPQARRVVADEASANAGRYGMLDE